MFKHQLGDKVKDRVTGFVGIVVTQSKFINGCIRYGVQSQKLISGKPQESEWFDEKQIVSVKSKAVDVEEKATGGPAPTPRLMANPKNY
jgi:hypothetical protein